MMNEIILLCNDLESYKAKLAIAESNLDEGHAREAKLIEESIQESGNKFLLYLGAFTLNVIWIF